MTSLNAVINIHSTGCNDWKLCNSPHSIYYAPCNFYDKCLVFRTKYRYTLFYNGKIPCHV